MGIMLTSGGRNPDLTPMPSDFRAHGVYTVGSGLGDGQSGGREDTEPRQHLASTPLYQDPQTLQQLPRLCPCYHVSMFVASNLLKTLSSFLPHHPFNPLAASEP